MTDPGIAEDLLAQGLALHRAGELQQAVDCYRRAIEADPHNAQCYNALGGALANLGEPEAAAEALQNAITKNPEYLDPHLHLATLWRIHGQAHKAEPLLRRALSLDDKSYPVWMELGAALMLQNRIAEAGECFEQALALAPGDADALHNLGRVAIESGQETRAITLYRQALQNKPDLATCHTNLGIALRMVRDFEGARACFEKALTLAPGLAAAINGWVGLLELEGRYDEALARIEAEIEADNGPLLQLAAARIERRLNRFDAAIERLQNIPEHELDEEVRMQRAFTLGDLYDETGQYEEAWANYRAANRMKRVTYSPAAWARHVDEIIAAFGPAKSFATAKQQDARPVFIVGMPRSGSSLLEQILASHPEVYGAGELTMLATVIEEIPLRVNGARPYPHCMDALGARRLTRLGRVYLDKLDEIGPRATRVTDKMWKNFEYLGLIERMLPGARVIHCRRDPLDTGLSCYFQNFSGQTGVPFSYDLAHIGAFYRDYQRLMAHWRDVCTLPIYELNYEDLVRTPEETSKALISFLDLKWDASCLDFHKNRRVTNTASAAQVRQPIYEKALARHLHYQQHLDPLKEALGQ